MIDEFNIIITGVGGQGGLTLSRIIAYAALIEGYNVRIGETLGMSQRFGTVQIHVRFGTKVRSPLIPIGQAHVLIGLEPLEAVRVVKYLNKQSIIIVNTGIIPSILNIIGKEHYPDLKTLKSILKNHCKRLIMIDALSEAKKLKLITGIGVLLLGAYAVQSENPIRVKSYKDAIKCIVPRKVEENIKLFERGMEIARSYNIYT